MTLLRRIKVTLAAGVAMTLAACSGELVEPALSTLPTDVVGLNYQSNGQEVRVFKFGPAGTYDFEASATGGNLLFSEFTVAADASREIWQQYDPDAAPASVTVTELVPPGMQVDSIVIWRVVDEGLISTTKLTGTNTATADGLDYVYGTWFKFYNSEKPDTPPGGTEGCTPGYWRQPHHFGNWVGYSPNQQFSSVFENAFPGMTLHQVVNLGGGGLNALGRHTVAALLNASGDVDYAANVADVIAAFNAVFPGGDYEGQKNIFEGWNEMGCPLGN